MHASASSHQAPSGLARDATVAQAKQHSSLYFFISRPAPDFASASGAWYTACLEQTTVLRLRD